MQMITIFLKIISFSFSHLLLEYYYAYKYSYITCHVSEFHYILLIIYLDYILMSLFFFQVQVINFFFKFILVCLLKSPVCFNNMYYVFISRITYF